MRKFTTLAILLFIATLSFAQNAETKELLTEIEGQWQLDDNGNVTYTRIIEVPNMTQDEIYNRAIDYFTYNYGSGKSVIQTNDKEQGRIVAKGLYDNVHIGVSLITTYIDCWHIVRVDIKDGKARVILTLTQYEKKIVGGNTPPSYSTTNVEQEFPINEKGTSKTVMGKAFYKSHKAAIATIDAIEKAIKEGNTSKNIENSDW